MIPLLLNRWAQLAAGIAIAFIVGFGVGHHQKTLEDASAQVAGLKQSVKTVAAAAKITASVSQAVEVKQAATAATTTSNLQKVSTYVPPKADAQCIVSTGAVRLLDAAAQDQPVPAAAVGVQAADPDLADSGVKLSELVSDDVANAGSFKDLTERLKAWEDWYDQQAANAGS